MTRANAKNRAMFKVGKLRGQPLVATSVSDHSHSRLSSGRKFLVDTGAQVSVIPPTSAQKKHGRHDGFHLQAVNSSPIATYGSQLLTLDLGLRRTFRWVFVIADVQSLILGADFLQHFGLMVDVRHSELSDGLTQLRVQGILSTTDSITQPIPPSNTTTD